MVLVKRKNMNRIKRKLSFVYIVPELIYVRYSIWHISYQLRSFRWVVNTNCAAHRDLTVCPRKKLLLSSLSLSAAKPIVVSQFQVLLRCKSGPEVFLHLIAQLKCDIRDRRVVDFAVKVTGIWRHIINGAFWLSWTWCLPSKPLDSSCLGGMRSDETRDVLKSNAGGRMDAGAGALALGRNFT